MTQQMRVNSWKQSGLYSQLILWHEEEVQHCLLKNHVFVPLGFMYLFYFFLAKHCFSVFNFKPQFPLRLVDLNEQNNLMFAFVCLIVLRCESKYSH